MFLLAKVFLFFVCFSSFVIAQQPSEALSSNSLTSNLQVKDSSLTDSLSKKEEKRLIYYRIITDSDSVEANASFVANQIDNLGYVLYKIYEESLLKNSSFVLPYDNKSFDDEICLKLKETFKQIDFDDIKQVDFLFSIDEKFTDSIFKQKEYPLYIPLNKNEFINRIELEGATFNDDIKSIESIFRGEVSYEIDSCYLYKNDYNVINQLVSQNYIGEFSVTTKDSTATLLSQQQIDSVVVGGSYNFDYSAKINKQSIAFYSKDSSRLSFEILKESSTKIQNITKLAEGLDVIKFPTKPITVKISFYDGIVDRIFFPKYTDLSLQEKEELLESLKEINLMRVFGRFDAIINFDKQKQDSPQYSTTSELEYKRVKTFGQSVNLPNSKLESIYSRYLKDKGTFLGSYHLRLFVGKENRIDSLKVLSKTIFIQEFEDIISRVVQQEGRVPQNQFSVIDIILNFDKSKPVNLINYKDASVSKNRFLFSDSLSFDSLNYLSRTEILNTVNDSSKRVDEFLRGRAEFINVDTINFLFELNIDNRGNVQKIVADTTQVIKQNVSVYNTIFSDMKRWRFRKSSEQYNYKMKFNYSFAVDDSLKQNKKSKAKTQEYYFPVKEKTVDTSIPLFFLIGGIAFNSLDSVKANLYNHNKIASSLLDERTKLSAFNTSGYSFYLSGGLNYPRYFLGNFVFGIYKDFQYQGNDEVSNLIFKGTKDEVTHEYNQSSYWGGVSINVFYSIMRNFVSLDDRDDFLIKFAFGRTLYNGFYLDEIRDDNTFLRYMGSSDNRFYSHVGFVFNKRYGELSAGVELGYKFLKFTEVKHKDKDSNIKYSELDETLSDGDLELDFSGLVFRVYFGI